MDELWLILLRDFMPIIIWEALIQFGFTPGISNPDTDEWKQKFIKLLDTLIKDRNLFTYLSDTNSLIEDISEAGMMSWFDEMSVKLFEEEESSSVSDMPLEEVKQANGPWSDIPWRRSFDINI